MNISGCVAMQHPVFRNPPGETSRPGLPVVESPGDEPDHDEILHRAAAGDAYALDRLLEVSLPLIRQKCPVSLRNHIDDVQQIVAYRLVRKFRSTTSPYQASTFFAYRSFLNKVTMNVAINLWHGENHLQSLEALNETAGFEPTMQSEAEAIDARLRLERCLELLPDGLMREVFRLRFLLDTSVEETLRILQQQGRRVSRQDVYRMAERSIGYLSKLPEVRDMFEQSIATE